MQIGGAEVLAVWWRKKVGNSFNAAVPRVSFHPPRNFNDQIVLHRLPQPKPQPPNSYLVADLPNKNRLPPKTLP